MKNILFIILLATACPAYAADELGKDDFVSTSVSAVFDKVNQYTSGEKRIMYSEDEMERQDDRYDRDALGRKIPVKIRQSGKTVPADE